MALQDESIEELRQQVYDLTAHLDQMSIESGQWTTTDIATMCLVFALERCAVVLSDTLDYTRVRRAKYGQLCFEMSERIMRAMTDE